MKKLLQVTFIILLGIGITACSKKNSDTIKLGVMSGPEYQLAVAAQTVAQQRFGLTIQLVSFNDYIMPNEALNDGDIDANYFQHQPYLDAQIKARGYQLSSIGNLYIYPMGLFSHHIANIKQLPKEAKIGIPNDPSNAARALLLLQTAGIIQLKPGVTITATPLDIVSNPKQVKIIQLDAAQLPRSLKDLSLAAINNTYAAAAGLHLRNALVKEGAESPYVNILVVKTVNKNDPRLLEILEAFRDPTVIQKAHDLFADGVALGWK